MEILHAKSQEDLAKIEIEVKNVTESTAQTFGMIIRKTKEQKLQELNQKKENLALEIGFGVEFLSLIYQVVHDFEIPVLKVSKKNRFDKTIFNFSQARIQEIEKEMLIYQTIIDEKHEETPQENIGKIERKDYRFTALPPMGYH